MRVSFRVTFAAGFVLTASLVATASAQSAQSPSPPPTAAPAATQGPAPGALQATAPGAAQAPAPSAPPGTPPSAGVPPATAVEVPVVVLALDKGDFRLTYEKTVNPSYKELQAMFKGAHLFEETLKALNGTLALPRDLGVVLRECGATDAHYEAQKPRVSICYELVDALATLFASQARTQEEAEQAGVAVAGATLYVFLQESARGLLDQWGVPAQGKPEEQVDQLATMVLLASGEEGEQTAINGVQAMLGEEGKAAGHAQLAGLAYWKAHPLERKRLDDILCWVYGKNPARFQDLVGDGTLAAERAGRCPAEYQALAQVWDPVLAPYLKKRPGEK